MSDHSPSLGGLDFVSGRSRGATLAHRTCTPWTELHVIPFRPKSFGGALCACCHKTLHDADTVVKIPLWAVLGLDRGEEVAS